MVSHMIKIQEGFFSAPPGTVLHITPNSYQTEICDVCGIRKKCDYFVGNFDNGEHTVFMDVCRLCQKELHYEEGIQ